MKSLFLLVFLVLSAFATQLTVTGTVVSDNQKMIGARYMGYVKLINFEIGDKVKREDTLFELESAEFDILKNQSDLAIEQAEIMVNMYRTRLDTINRERRTMKVNGRDTGMDYENLTLAADNVAAGLAAAQALVKSATEKIKQVATLSDYLEVKAPNDGIIVEKRIRVGDLIAPGMLTMVLVDLDHLEIEAQVAESNLIHTRADKQVSVAIPSLKYETKGIIKSVVPNANPMAHTFTIRVKFDKTHDMIFPGMYAKVRIDLEKGF